MSGVKVSSHCGVSGIATSASMLSGGAERNHAETSSACSFQQNSDSGEEGRKREGRQRQMWPVWVDGWLQRWRQLPFNMFQTTMGTGCAGKMGTGMLALVYRLGYPPQMRNGEAMAESNCVPPSRRRCRPASGHQAAANMNMVMPHASRPKLGPRWRLGGGVRCWQAETGRLATGNHGNRKVNKELRMRSPRSSAWPLHC